MNADRMPFENPTIDELYHWFRMICSMSIDRLEPLLHRLGLPLDSDSRKKLVEPAKHVTRTFYTLEPLIVVGEVIPEGQQLFLDFRDAVIREVGADKTADLWTWGNALIFDSSFTYSIGFHKDILKKDILADLFGRRPERSRDVHDIPEPTLSRIKRLVSVWWEETGEWADLCDAYDNIELDQWEHDVIWGHYLDPYERKLPPEEIDPPLTPHDIVLHLMMVVKDKAFLASLRDNLAEDEILILQSRIEGHPNWQRDQARTDPMFHKAMRFTDLIALC